jgi:predicted nucleic acid-binding protein
MPYNEPTFFEKFGVAQRANGPVLADTCIWIDYESKSDAILDGLLEVNRAFIHPYVIRELAVGNLKDRQKKIEYLRDLPTLLRVDKDDLLDSMEKYNLHGRGLSMVDVNLLMSCKQFGATIYTRDKLLAEIAGEMGVLFDVGSFGYFTAPVLPGE